MINTVYHVIILIVNLKDSGLIISLSMISTHSHLMGLSSKMKNKKQKRSIISKLKSNSRKNINHLKRRVAIKSIVSCFLTYEKLLTIVQKFLNKNLKYKLIRMIRIQKFKINTWMNKQLIKVQFKMKTIIFSMLRKNKKSSYL